MRADRNAARGERNAAPGERNAAPGERNAAPGERNAAPGDRNAALGDRNAALGDRDAALRDRNAAPGGRNATLGDRDAAIGDRNAALRDRDPALRDRNAALGDREPALGDRDAALGDRKAALRDRNAAFWADAALGWARHADRQDEYGRPLGAAALDRLRPAAGERILDVGCGCGGTTAELAAAVGSHGAVTGLDLSREMVAAAARRFPAVRFVAADIETVDIVAGAPFDAAYSRMVLMLFADPVAGLSAIRRSLRPGGRLAATVFRDGPANPWLPLALLGAAPSLGPMPPLPAGDEPGPFAWADPARIRDVLSAAGFARIRIDALDVTVPAPDDGETVAEWLIEVGPAGAAYRRATAAAQADARRGAARLLDRFRSPGVGYRLPAGIHVVTAEKPRAGS
jgi:SAM-dependent methyltransferase